jgi:hypothetical protein
MRTGLLGIALVGAASLALTGAAHAQSTKGTGKVSISIIKWDPTLPDPDGPGLHGPGGVTNILQKAAGTFAGKPKASIAGLAPTGGTITTLKLAKDIGDPLKPGFPPGEYVLEVETGASPDGDALIKTFARLTVDALNKCTVHVSPSVKPGSPYCGGGGQPLCDDDEVGKCSFSTYQIAGADTTLLNCSPLPTYQCGVRDGEPNASRIRIRQLLPADQADCQTGYILLGTTAIFPLGGPISCANGPVVGIGGVGSADVDP